MARTAAEKGATVINHIKVGELIKENGISASSFLLDHDGKVGHAYGAKTTPHMFVVAKDGTLAYSGAIDDDPRGEKSERVQYVDEAVRALLRGQPVPTAETKAYGCSVKYP